MCVWQGLMYKRPLYRGPTTLKCNGYKAINEN